MSVADWASDPLLGTASRRSLSGTRAPFREGGSEVGVDVVERETGREHQDLRVVQQLAELLGGPLGPLVLGGHPGLGALLDQLLADRMDAGVEGGDGAAALRARLGLLAELGPELLERLHLCLLSGVRALTAYGVPAGAPATAHSPSAARLRPVELVAAADPAQRHGRG